MKTLTTGITGPPSASTAQVNNGGFSDATTGPGGGSVLLWRQVNERRSAKISPATLKP